MIIIKETTYDDIRNLQSLWADEDVMALGEDPNVFVYLESAGVL